MINNYKTVDLSDVLRCALSVFGEDNPMNKSPQINNMTVDISDVCRCALSVFGEDNPMNKSPKLIT